LVGRQLRADAVGSLQRQPLSGSKDELHAVFHRTQTTALLKLYRDTGNRFYMQLLTDIAHALPQFMSTKENPWPKFNEGWISDNNPELDNPEHTDPLKWPKFNILQPDVTSDNARIASCIY